MSEFLDNLDTLNRIIKDLRAELAAERERAEAHFLASREADDELATIRAERDALRALLREARIIVADEDRPRMDASELLARIDAALHGDGDGSETENI